MSSCLYPAGKPERIAMMSKQKACGHPSASVRPDSMCALTGLSPHAAVEAAGEQATAAVRTQFQCRTTGQDRLGPTARMHLLSPDERSCTTANRPKWLENSRRGSSNPGHSVGMRSPALTALSYSVRIRACISLTDSRQGEDTLGKEVGTAMRRKRRPRSGRPLDYLGPGGWLPT